MFLFKVKGKINWQSRRTTEQQKERGIASGIVPRAVVGVNQLCNVIFLMGLVGLQETSEHSQKGAIHALYRAIPLRVIW
jgi:hypothetical protein